MKFNIAILAVAGLVMSGSALAAAMPDLAKKNGCIACHSIDHRIVGPAWMDVSKKYKGEAGAEEKLIAKVSNGGTGVWGKASMPAIDPTGKKHDEIKQLVEFILSLAK